jgi:hypothetical protein
VVFCYNSHRETNTPSCWACYNLPINFPTQSLHTCGLRKPLLPLHLSLQLSGLSLNCSFFREAFPSSTWLSQVSMPPLWLSQHPFTLAYPQRSPSFFPSLTPTVCSPRNLSPIPLCPVSIYLMFLFHWTAAL